MKNYSKKISFLFLCTYAILMVVTYPLALLPPGTMSLAFHISLPSLFLLSLFSLPVIFSANYKPNHLYLICIGLFIFSAIFNYFRFLTHGMESIQIIGYMTIPLAAAVVVRQATTRLLLFNNIKRFGFYFWLVQILHGIWSLRINDEVVGLSGNRNWMASSLLALMPWALIHIHDLISQFLYRQHPGNAFHTKIIAILVVCIPSLFLMTHCRSRGAWLALCVLIILNLTVYLIRNFHNLLQFLVNMKKVEKAFSAVVAMLAFVTVVVYLNILILYLASPMMIIDFERLVKSDVRLPLWASTLSLMKDNDFFLSLLKEDRSDETLEANPLGIGAGRFTKAFAEYRSQSSYHERLVAAPITKHPHNEFLFIGAQLGFFPALAWLMTLIPLMLKIQSRSVPEECARFSAISIYFHGFFDMTITQSPGNLMAFFCLGICLQDYLVKTIPALRKSYSSHLRKSIVSLSLLILLCGGSYAIVKDFRTDWYNRQGYLDQASGKYQSAFKNYTSAMAINPENIQSHIFAASIALDKMKNPELALSILLKAQAIDPSFGHINGQIGQAFGSLGYHKDALDYLIAECKLYPKNPKVFQNYFNGLISNGQYDLLFPTSAYLQKLYSSKAVLQHRQDGLTHKINQWTNSVQNGDSEAALAAANDICKSINTNFLDPLIYNLTNDQEWPSKLLTGSFNPFDYVYWRQLLLLKRLSLKILEEPHLKQLGLHEVKKLHSFFRGHLTIDISSPPFEFPNLVWQNRTGSPLSCYFFFYNLAYQCGFTPVLSFTNEGHVNDCYLLTMTHAYKVNLMKEDSPEEVTSFDKEDSYISLFEGMWKMGFIPQEFWLRNQILGTIIKRHAKEPVPRFDEIPIIRLLTQISRNESKNKNFNFKKFCLSEPSTTMLKQISNQ